MKRSRCQCEGTQISARVRMRSRSGRGMREVSQAMKLMTLRPGREGDFRHSAKFRVRPRGSTGGKASAKVEKSLPIQSLPGGGSMSATRRWRARPRAKASPRTRQEPLSPMWRLRVSIPCRASRERLATDADAEEDGGAGGGGGDALVNNLVPVGVEGGARHLDRAGG